MTSTTLSTAERIRALNDAFRRTFVGGMVMITAGVEAMPVDQRRSLLAKVRAFDAFTEDNDPHGEHDFGLFFRPCLPTGNVRFGFRRHGNGMLGNPPSSRKCQVCQVRSGQKYRASAKA